MRQEAEAYESYRRHLEEKKRTSHLYDSDDYASEWEDDREDKDMDDEEEEEEEEEEEKFAELRAQSEEELYEAQEKSIRILERQIRKQDKRDQQRKSEEQVMLPGADQLAQQGSFTTACTALPTPTATTGQVRAAGTIRQHR
ncbi:hypothetical protein Pmani_035144 [Petrolisthes manimaculis]|uniref:Uncharacterized protein n=1 Tax=Petrolisthes manimaculis TaxID=1843537 RepID=A0AAE1TNH4_9EUCA|nr:hypothetical protein Pmani_035144 [Petrolisthes manimaculis]